MVSIWLLVNTLVLAAQFNQALTCGLVFIWFLCHKLLTLLSVCISAFKKVVEKEKKELLKKMSLSVSAKRQFAIGDNTTHVGSSAPYNRCTALTCMIWNVVPICLHTVCMCVSC